MDKGEEGCPDPARGDDDDNDDNDADADVCTVSE